MSTTHPQTGPAISDAEKSPPAPSHDTSDLYAALGIPATDGPRMTARELREHYLRVARQTHPDASTLMTSEPLSSKEAEALASSVLESVQGAFSDASRAWSILGNPRLRALYDAAGIAGIVALESVQTRADALADIIPAGVDGETLDFLSETGQLAAGLLTPVIEVNGPDSQASSTSNPGSIISDGSPLPISDGQTDESACPRSVSDAIQKITAHPDYSVRYYALWWIYRFKIPEATDALIEVLTSSNEQTSLGGFGLRRRAALALGAVAPMSPAVLDPLAEGLHSSDYYVRYRCAEAIASISLRELRRQNDYNQRTAAHKSAKISEHIEFPPPVLRMIKDLLKAGATELRQTQTSRNGSEKQESIFSFDHLQPEVAEKLRAVFEARRSNEARSRRTTMTPQLGVSAVDEAKDQPFEWLLKAYAAIMLLNPSSSSNAPSTDVLGHVDADTIHAFLDHPLPLVRYAAHKALYVITRDDRHAQALVKGLEFGVEHHYSQRVLIRDLGDIGYAPAAAAIANCGMVENSFKILSLKNILAKLRYDVSEEQARDVLYRIDSLL